MNRIFRNNGLSLALMTLFLATLCGQWAAGRSDYNDDQRVHGLPTVSVFGYLRTGHFYQALAENWESEFLQMGMYVVLAAHLYQKGSPESNDPDEVDIDHPQDHHANVKAPWPVRRGGWVLRLYSHSLSLAFFMLFALSFALHIVGGHAAYAHEQLLNGQPQPSISDYFFSGTFWFESMQNWQSEFLSLAGMVYLSVFLREKNSAESKAVESPHTAHE